ncbi:hypothetical protein BD560DRAFT_387345 [Blakeslea trispora]|nr:hypothetical protein BD560DRAFT_387337 [Blakeslea trispora]KAI8380845.1 hypothetical protein BD560DRAFT_387342 [Blakeslea trispora]KAI8380846.1 hypothetical protein BD560DRAFT_387345 [Blakeslea trispora]
MLLIFNIRYSRLTKMLLRCIPLMLWSTGLVLTSDTARLLLFKRTSYSRLGYALYWLSRLL